MYAVPVRVACCIHSFPFHVVLQFQTFRSAGCKRWRGGHDLGANAKCNKIELIALKSTAIKQSEMTTNQLPKYGAIAVEVVDDNTSTQIEKGDDNHDNRTYTPYFVGFLVLIMTILLVLISPIYVDEDGTRTDLLSAFSHLHHHHHHHHDDNTPLFYNEQIIDHFSEDGEGLKSYWSHRYYKSTRYFGGPGYPIFLVVGGEGPLDNGMLYPFVTDVLAKRFNAAVVQAEHRFYGVSSPVVNATVPELLQLLTPQQAIADMLRLVNVYLKEADFRGCSPHRSSELYCPLITIGGSYPGFLSAMFRFRHPDVVDAAYASAAPLYMYAQKSDPNIFYDIVTTAAERASPGCPEAVKKTLLDVVDSIMAASSLQEAADLVGVCEGSIPNHIQTQQELSDALVQMASFTFASDNSEGYPPGPDTNLVKTCKVFQNPDVDSIGAMRGFMDRVLIEGVEMSANCDVSPENCDEEEELKSIRKENGGKDCFDLGAQFPDSPDSELVGGVLDSYDDGTMWEFQTCTTVIFLCGFSESSMFPARNASYEDLTKDCQDSFGVTPRPRELAELWGFDDLVHRGASRILFTNGVQDMWAGGSIMTNLSDSLLALNFENGAHHSDLSHQGPTDKDTADIKAGYLEIAEILGMWLDEIREESKE